MDAYNADVEIVPYSEDWLERLLDLMESEGVVDPLYGSNTTKEERKTNLRKRMSSSTTRASFVAVRGSEVIGSAHAIIPAMCGATQKKMAWLSVTIALNDVGVGIGARLVERIGGEMKTQGVDLLRIGMLDSWEAWCAFLRKCGFERNEQERTADAVLLADAPIPHILPETSEIVRPISLPEERRRVIDFAEGELAQDLPGSCAPEARGQAWWEYWPDFDPIGFLVAEEKRTGEIVGYICPVIVKDGRGVHGIIHGMDVAKRLVGTKLRDKLVLQAVMWLRDKGVADITYRVHIGYRNEEDVFERLGYRMNNAAAVWYKPVS